MWVEAVESFDGDFGTGTPVQHFEPGAPFEVPERIGGKWISRGLVRLAPKQSYKGRQTPTEAMNDGE